MPQILVIDDDATIRLTLERILKRQGYDVVVAADGQEGLQLAKDLKPALIICDWEMPFLSGIEVCRQVKSSPQLSTSFFILLTARGEVDDRVTGLDAGADDFLAKPPEINELKARVRAGLRSSQLSRELQQQTSLLRAELAEAATYVKSLLPQPLQSPIQTAWEFIPSDQLGGDGLNYQWLDGDRLAIYLLDVSGHGVGSALLSASVMHVLRSLSLPDADFGQPQKVLQALNLAFQMDEQNDKYFTIWYGVYYCQSQRLVYASGGHPPALLLSDQATTPQVLKVPGIPVGMLPGTKYAQAECRVPPGSTLYLYSDGIYEITLANGQMGTLQNFIDLLTTIHQGSEEVLPTLVSQIQQRNQSPLLDDDLSVLQVRFG